MPSVSAFLLIALSAIAFKASEIAGDPTVSSNLPTVAPVASSFASYPATVTANTDVSAILATATLAPGFGNPASILSYPRCAQVCGNASVARANCDVSNIDCACGAVYLSIAAACEQITCSASDRAVSQYLGEQLCGPVFRNTPSLGLAATLAVASATSVAAAVASRDPTKSASYPACAQNCQNSGLPASGCGSLANRSCVCTSVSFNAEVGGCERATCSASDFQIVRDLADSLCNPVGGFGNASNASSSVTASPSPIAFTGDAIAVMKLSFGWIVIGLVGVLGWQVLL